MLRERKPLRMNTVIGILHINWAVGNSLMGPFPGKASPAKVRTSGVLKQGHASLQCGLEVNKQIPSLFGGAISRLAPVLRHKYTSRRPFRRDSNKL